jgi:glucosamine-6-phosphate deaminase
MKIYELSHTLEWTKTADSVIRTKVRDHKAKRLFLPAGETPVPLYSCWKEQPPLEFDQIQTFVQLDEILRVDHSQTFQSFFEVHLPQYCGRFEWIDDAEKGADIAVLGIGTNGHLGFHEPNVPNEFYSGCLKLNSSTCTRLKISANSIGLTYGLKAFFESKAAILLVRGASKHEILKRCIDGKIAAPAAQLMSHPDLTIITDFKI